MSKPFVVNAAGMLMLSLAGLTCCRDFEDPATNTSGPEKTSTGDETPDHDRTDAQANGSFMSPDAGSSTPLDASTRLVPTTRDASMDLSSAQPGVTSPDWSAALDAVYTFEDENDLGSDSSGHGWHLSTLGAVELVDAHAQGSQSLHFEPDASLWSNDTFFRTFPGTSLTFGGWVRTEPTDAPYVLISNGDGTQGGFSLQIVPSVASIVCEVADGKGGFAIATPRTVVADFQQWTHLVCRYDDATKSIQLFVNGVALKPSAQADAGIGEGSGRFALGSPLDGELDEVFFTRATLNDEQVTRIWVCGIDGLRCSCSETDAAAYTACGSFDDCSGTSLPACDSVLSP